MDDKMFKQLIELFSEYEWRANRTLNDFSASDFDLFIEIYTPDMILYCIKTVLMVIPCILPILLRRKAHLQI